MSADHSTISLIESRRSSTAFSNAVTDGRCAGLDWLRAAAALAVVALHSAIPYMTHPMPHLGWCVRPASGSPFVDALAWTINGCVMPIFFVMGGYLAAGLWQRHSADGFIRHRTRRLLLPLAIAFCLVLPADMYVWLAGWVAEGLIPLKKMRSIKLSEPLTSQFWGVAHLWYLECLWCLSVAAWAIGRVWRGVTIPDSWRMLHPTRRPGLILGTVFCGLILAIEPEILLGFRQRWWPSPLMTLFYGAFFLAGWTWPRSESNATDRETAAATLVKAGLILPVLLVLIHHLVDAPRGGVEVLGTTAALALFAWLASTSLFALALAGPKAAAPRSIAAVAAASFWMYLVHHPIVGLTQLALLRSSLGPDARFAVAFASGVWLSLASYAVFVRGTWLGNLLNGRQTRPLTPGVAAPAEIPVRKAA
jgi:glucan biosynthesis protein C